VSDTGIGIPADAQSALFRSFSQADTSISRRFGGTGLGLAISKKIVEQQGGTIELLSKVGEGSTFWFDLPFRLGSREVVLAKRVAERDAQPSTQPLRILLTDDSPINQRVVASILQRRGHRITLANNGQEAVDAVQKEIFDAILMDVHMPEMDGLTATRMIRALPPPASKVLIVALTAAAFPEDAEACLLAGMDDILHKPVSGEQLFKAVERHERYGAAWDDEDPPVISPGGVGESGAIPI
jgi:CheY-like chemotaxis protein